MPKRNDIKKVMIIGAGPIVIGQGCEFDYSGVQACKALKNEGYEIVLVNSNPATIMTDPEFADRTYIEPLSADILHEIIRRERPDAILPTLGGQTALNLAVELYDKGILKRYGVEMIGASVKSINKAEDRQLFKKTMKEIGLDLPRSGSAHTMQEAVAVAEAIGTWPLIIRPGFTLGGTGGGIANNKEEFHQIVSRGLFESRNSEVLIEESLLGWKEYEMEVMRDKKNNAVIVCSIENFDPMGVHTGDSITVAPIQTLTDREYQSMRDDSLRVMEAIGVETGGSNVQWAVNPVDGRRIIIEMNPRVSRSSALASKATGFPIAKIAALLAVGYTLDELINDITGETPACFEPALDYIVTKIPRFTFEKFQKADSTLGTQMKSVGEAMAIGKTFKQSFQKALRSLEIGRSGFGADGKDETYEKMTNEELNIALQVPKADRVFALRAAFKRGYSVDEVYEYSRIDKYFLRHLHEITAFEDEISSYKSLDNLANDKEAFNKELTNKLLPVDVYVGGKEHAAMHLIYARFMTKAMRDLGYLNFDEPFTKLIHQGMILGPDGNKMSKSKGNTVSPDTYIDKYGADVFRMYLMFGFDYQKGGPWDDKGIEAMVKYFTRVETLIEKVKDLQTQENAKIGTPEKDLLRLMNQTIKSMTMNIESFQFNTAIARNMELLNAINNYLNTDNVNNAVVLNVTETFIKLLAPLAPHFAEEEWHVFGKTTFIYNEEWPTINEKDLKGGTVNIPVQVNGKLKTCVAVDAEINPKDMLDIIKKDEKVAKILSENTVKKEIYVPGKILNIVI